MAKAKAKDDFHSDDEVAKRRDELVRRMANTPPQPTVKPSRPLKKRRKAAVGHAGS